ncbi:oligosaccharide flippase family protein [Bacteroides sp. GD17]|jgi:O-antigen/teichoic acid export membrane protein|uniref:lipopolysaccharide biosynthesis protein n=1 Tax=Bacteroides sp. GD17 TaxID=3139826 RepID=UPI00313DAE62
MRNFIKLSNWNDIRYAKAIKTSIVSLLVQFVNILTSFISVPLLINAVGVERYGLWAAFAAAFSFLSFSDFGLGIGMQNRISICIANNERIRIQSIFVSSLYMSIFMAIILFCIVLFLVNYIAPSVVNWIKYNDSSIDSDITPTIISVCLIIGLGVIAGIIQRTFDAFQEGYIYRYINVFSRLLSLFFLYWGTCSNASLAQLVFVFNGTPYICLIISIFFCCKRYSLTLDLALFDIHELTQIFKVGIVGLGAGISIFLVSQLTPLLISFNFGLNQVAAYSVIMRVLNVAVLFYTLVILPFWPAVTDAYAKKEREWIKRTLRKMRVAVFSSLIIILVLAGIFSRPFILWWTNMEIIPPMELIISCLLFVGLYVWNTQVSVFLNAASLFRGQATYGILLSLLSLYTVYTFSSLLSECLVIIIVSIGLLLRNICMEFELKYKLLKRI